MSASKQLLNSVGGTNLVTTNAVIQGLRALAPWNLTGPASHVEWKDVPVGAQEYRSSSPAATSTNVKVPQNSVQRIYDTRYFTRDSRRFVLKGDLRKTILSSSNYTASLRDTSAEIAGIESIQPVGMPSSKADSTRVSLLDDPNSGFT